MRSAAYETIKGAIRDRKQILTTYGGFLRETCPHSIGRKNGQEKALFYQFGGQSSSGAIQPGSSENWRCMFIDELGPLTVRDGDWYTAANHSIPQTCVDWVDLDTTM